MGIDNNNLDPKSHLKAISIRISTSGLSNGSPLNVGVVPVACRLKDLFVGTTASAIAYVFSTKVNNVDISNGFSVGALTASGGVQKVLAPPSPKLITAGSLISFVVSSTAATAEIVGSVRFSVEKSEK